MDEKGNVDCVNVVNCRSCVRCNNSTWCGNSVGCNNCVSCFYCHGLTLEKFHVFNKKVSEKEYFRIKGKIQDKLGYWKHPTQLSKQDIQWLEKNVKQFNQKVLNQIIEFSELPTKPKETKVIEK